MEDYETWVEWRGQMIANAHVVAGITGDSGGQQCQGASPEGPLLSCLIG